MMLSVMPSERYSICCSVLAFASGNTASESMTFDFVKRRLRPSGVVNDADVLAASPCVAPRGNTAVGTKSTSGGTRFDSVACDSAVNGRESLTSGAPSWRQNFSVSSAKVCWHMGQRFIQPQDEIYEPLEQGSNDLGVPAHLIRLRRPAPERQLDQHSRRSWNEIIQIDFRRVREQKQRATTSSGTAYDPYP